MKQCRNGRTVKNLPNNLIIWIISTAWYERTCLVSQLVLCTAAQLYPSLSGWSSWCYTWICSSLAFGTTSAKCEPKQLTHFRTSNSNKSATCTRPWLGKELHAFIAIWISRSHIEMMYRSSFKMLRWNERKDKTFTLVTATSQFFCGWMTGVFCEPAFQRRRSIKHTTKMDVEPAGFKLHKLHIQILRICDACKASEKHHYLRWNTRFRSLRHHLLLRWVLDYKWFKLIFVLCVLDFFQGKQQLSVPNLPTKNWRATESTCGQSTFALNFDAKLPLSQEIMGNMRSQHLASCNLEDHRGPRLPRFQRIHQFFGCQRHEVQVCSPQWPSKRRCSIAA